eukprot:10554080-Lingulodinium_polyedra.AAC.1
MKAVSRQAEELTKESSAKAGALGQGGVLAHDHGYGGDDTHWDIPYSSRGADWDTYMDYGASGDA